MKEDKEYLKEKARLKVQKRIKIEELIEGGKWNFVLVRGVLMFGGFMFIAVLLFDRFVGGYGLGDISLSFNVVIWAFAGLLWGLYMWKFMNDKLKELKKK